MQRRQYAEQQTAPADPEYQKEFKRSALKQRPGRGNASQNAWHQDRLEMHYEGNPGGFGWTWLILVLLVGAMILAGIWVTRTTSDG
jgi:hypothetical protein